MYNTSTKYKNDVYKCRQHELKIYIDGKQVNDSYILDCIPTHELFDNKIELGGTPMQEVELKLHNNAIPSTYKEVYIESGILNDEIVPVGYFIIKKIEVEDAYTTKITVCDYMDKFEFKFDASKYIPCTIGILLQKMCDEANVELATKIFLNSDTLVGTYDNTLTARKFLGWIAEQAGGFAYIGRDGKLYIKSIEEAKYNNIYEDVKLIDMITSIKASGNVFKINGNSNSLNGKIELNIDSVEENLVLIDLFRQIYIQLVNGNLEFTIPKELENVLEYKLNDRGELEAYIYDIYKNKLNFSMDIYGNLIADVDKKSKVIISQTKIIIDLDNVSLGENDYIYYDFEEQKWKIFQNSSEYEITNEVILNSLNELLNISFPKGNIQVYLQDRISAISINCTNFVEIPIELFKDYTFSKELFNCTRLFYEDGIRTFEYGNQTGNTIYIDSENMFIIDDGEGNCKQLEKVFDKVQGLKLRGFKGTSIIDIALDIGDIVYIDEEPVLYQGNWEYQGRNKANISSMIQSKANEESSARKITSEIKIRRIQSSINQLEGIISLLGSEVSEAKKKISQFELTVDSIKASVSEAIDLTNSVKGVNPLVLSDCMQGEIKYLSIEGDDILNPLYPSKQLYPNKKLYPTSSGTIIITNVETGIKKKYKLNLKEPLRKYNDEIGDKFIYDVINSDKEQNFKCYVVRKVGINNSGEKFILPEEEIEKVDTNIELLEGTNIVDLNAQSKALINATYVKKNEYTKYFTSIYQVESLIEALSNRITLELKEKLDTKNLIARINMAILGKEDVEIPEEIEKSIIQIFADILEVNTTFWKLSRQGRMISKEGEIAGFDFSEEGFKKEIDGTYKYTYFDVITALEYIQWHITLPDALIDLYDIDNDGVVTVIDVRRMMLIIEGKYENTKKIKGTVNINPNDASDAFSVKVDDIVKTVIGLFNIYSYAIRCSNFYVGDYDKATNIFQGIQINEETKQIKITRGNSTIIIGMDEQDRCTIKPSTGTIVCPDSNVEAVNFHAGGGRCMHSTNMTHYYACNWTGTQLQFFVDNTNVGTLSDKRLKNDITEIDIKLLNVIEKIELKQFKLLNRFGRTSFGVIAQDLISLFKVNGLNIWDYDLVTQAQYELDDKTLYYIVDYEQLLILKNKCIEEKMHLQQKQINFLINKLNCEQEMQNYLRGEINEKN